MANKRSKKIENLAVEPLKKVLIDKWQELDKMLFCTKIPKCVLKYKKKHKLGGNIVKPHPEYFYHIGASQNNFKHIEDKADDLIICHQ